MNIAAAVRKEKEQHPESFCPVKGCLWRTTTRYGYKPCETHPIRTCVTCHGCRAHCGEGELGKQRRSFTMSTMRDPETGLSST